MRNLDLIDWTMQEARRLNPAHPVPTEPDITASLNRVLEALDYGPSKPNADDTIIQFPAVPSIELAANSSAPSPKETATPKLNAASNLLTSTETAPLPSQKLGAGTKSALLKAIVEPDIYTAPVDRDRAIVLRWMLRDIKSNRLKWSSINQHELRNLIDMGLVEIQNDEPVLTNLGVNAVI